MKFELIRDSSILVLVCYILYLLVNFMFSRLMKKEEKKDTAVENKLDTLLKRIEEQNVMLERLNVAQTNLNHSVDRVVRREDDLRSIVTELRMEVSTLKEWKRNQEN